MMVNALDDPLVPESQIKPIYELCQQNEKLIMVTTKWGGHLGYHEGFIPKRKTWMDRCATEYIDSLFTRVKQKKLSNVSSLF